MKTPATIFVIILGAVGYFLKQHYDRIHQLFFNTEKLTDEERCLVKAAIQVNDSTEISTHLNQFNDLPSQQRKELRQSYSIQLIIEQIEATDFSVRYLKAVDLLLLILVRIFDEKTVISQKPGIFERYWGAKVFTVNSYVFCLKMAFFYPLLFTFISWLIETHLTIGELQFTQALTIPQRFLALFSFLAFVCGFWYSLTRQGTLSTLGFISSLFGIVGITFSLAFAFTGLAIDHSITGTVFAIFCALAIGGTLIYCIASFEFASDGFALMICVFIAGISSIAGATSESSLVSAAVSGSVSGAVAGVIAITIMVFANISKDASYPFRQSTLDKLVKRPIFWIVFNILALVFCVTSILMIIKFGKTDKLQFLLIPVFLGILPFVNALIDWISLNITRALLIRIHKIHTNKKKFNAWFSMIFLAIGDLILATLLAIIMTSILAITVSAINWLSFVLFDKIPLNLISLMEDLRNPDQFWQVAWLLGMVFSTLIPTLLHLFYTLSAIVLWPKIGWHSRWIGKFWTSNDAKVKIFHCHVFSNMATAVLAIFVFILTWLSIALWQPLMVYLWSWVDFLLTIIAPKYQTPLL